MTVNVQLSLGFLSMSLTIPNKYQSATYRTRGLYGNNDGDPSNDMTFPNGTLLPESAADREIFAMGESCKKTRVRPEKLLHVFCLGNFKYLEMYSAPIGSWRLFNFLL